MSKKTYSIDVTVRVFVEAESSVDAETEFDKKFFEHFSDAEYYNLQSREGGFSALYVGDSTDENVWRPSVSLGKGKHYFTSDGTFGDASDILIVDTSNWTESDWSRIDECSDNDRKDIADIIDAFRSGRWS